MSPLLLNIIPHQAGVEDVDVSQEGGHLSQDQFWLIVLSYTVEWVFRMRQGDGLERKLSGKAFDKPSVTGWDLAGTCCSLTEA